MIKDKNIIKKYYNPFLSTGNSLLNNKFIISNSGTSWGETEEEYEKRKREEKRKLRKKKLKRILKDDD